MTCFELGSMRETVPSARLPTQIEPKPAVILAGSTPTGTSARSLPLAGSMTTTEFGRINCGRAAPRVATKAASASTQTAAAAPAAIREDGLNT